MTPWTNPTHWTLEGLFEPEEEYTHVNLSIFGFSNHPSKQNLSSISKSVFAQGKKSNQYQSSRIPYYGAVHLTNQGVISQGKEIVMKGGYYAVYHQGLIEIAFFQKGLCLFFARNNKRLDSFVLSNDELLVGSLPCMLKMHQNQPILSCSSSFSCSSWHMNRLLVFTQNNFLSVQ